MADFPQVGVELIAKGAAQFDSALKGAGASVNQLGSVLTGVMAAGAVALGTALTSSISKAADFEQAMSNVGAISLASAEDMAALEKAALAAGSTTAFTATEAAEGLAFLAMAGFDVNQSITALPAVLAAAAAGNMDLATTADIVSNVIGGFRLEAEEAGRVADVLAMTSANSNTNIEMLGQTMKFAAPTAANLGWSLEETAAAAGFLADAGIQSSLAGTHLRAIMGSLATPTQAAAKQFSGLGLEMRWADGTMKSMEVIISDMERAFEDLGPAQKDFALNAIFGREAAGSFSILLGRGGEALGDYTHELEGASEMFGGMGAAQAQASMQLDNFRGAMTLLRSAIDGAMVTIGMAFLPILKQLAESVIPMIEVGMNRVKPIIEAVGVVFEGLFANLSEGMSPLNAFIEAIWDIAPQGVLDFLVSLRDDILPSLMGTIASIVEPIAMWVSENVKLSDVLTAVGIAIASFVIPALISMMLSIAPLILTFAALVAGVALLRTAWENDWGGIQEKTAFAIGFIQEVVQAGLAYVQGLWATHGATIIATAQEMWTAVQVTTSTIGASIQEFWSIHGAQITQIFQAAWTAILNIAMIAGTAWYVFTTSTFAGLQTAWEVFGSAIKQIFQSALDVIQGILQAFNALVKGDWEALGNNIQSISTAMMTGTLAIFKGFLDLIAFGIGKSFDQMITDAIKGSQMIIDGIKDAFLSFNWGNIATAIITGITGGLLGGTPAVVQAAKDLASSAYQAAKSALGIQSPSKQFFNLGEWSAEGYVDAIYKNEGMVTKAVTGMVDMSLEAGMLSSLTSPVASPSQQQTTINNNRNTNINFSGNYSSQPTITDQSDLLGLLAGYA
jgi:TP901 family phage tail tape measure protein